MHKISVSERFYKEIKNVKKTLKERGQGKISTEELMDSFLNECLEIYFPNFIEEKTPFEYRINTLLKNEESKKELEKLLSKMNKPKKSKEFQEVENGPY